MVQWAVYNRDRGTVVARNAKLADSHFSRLRGLIGRRRLEPGDGLIIRPCSSIHTFFMAFPIEVLFVGEANRVLLASPAIAAWRIGPIVPQARYVVELPVGSISTSRTQRGDVLELVPEQQAR